MEDLSESQTHTLTDVCLFMQQSAESGGVGPMHFRKEIIFEMESVEDCLW